MYADHEVPKKVLFYFTYSTQSPKNVLSFIHHLRGWFEPRSRFISVYNNYDCRGECCPEYNDCCWLQRRWSWVILYPNCFLNNSSQYCTPFSGLYFLLFLVTTPPWSKFLSSNSLWSYTLSKMRKLKSWDRPRYWIQHFGKLKSWNRPKSSIQDFGRLQDFSCPKSWIQGFWPISRFKLPKILNSRSWLISRF